MINIYFLLGKPSQKLKNKVIMKGPTFSIVISTYNCKDILKKCFNALFNQTYPQSDYEVIVIDDGSMDGTEGLMKSMIDESPVILRYFSQENKGPATARNIGIRNANGKIILFIGDDIIASSTLLEEHLKWHKLYPNDNIAVLGYVTWSPEIEIIPFMKWLENGGPQFAFWQIKDKTEVDAQDYFYTSNISLKKKFLLENNGFFDEEFPYPAFEDIELGYRLKKKGMILKYNKDAIAYHYHYTSLRDACLRMIRVGYSSQILAKKIGDKQVDISNRSFFEDILSKVKFMVYYLIAKLYEKRSIKEDIFGYIMGYCSCLGAERYRKQVK